MRMGTALSIFLLLAFMLAGLMQLMEHAVAIMMSVSMCMIMRLVVRIFQIILLRIARMLAMCRGTIIMTKVTVLRRSTGRAVQLTLRC